MRSAEPGTPLTVRERRILERVAAGRTDAWIGRDLDIPVDTVKGTLKRAFIRLGAGNRAHAVYLALKSGVIE